MLCTSGFVGDVMSVHNRPRDGNEITVNTQSVSAGGSTEADFDRGLDQILHDQLHWLDVANRVLFKLAVTVYKCLNGRAPPYLSEHCIPVSSADTRRHLRSANCHILAVPPAFSAQHLRPSGVFSYWPSCLELSLGIYPGSNEQYRLFQASTETSTCALGHQGFFINLVTQPLTIAFSVYA